MRRNIQRLIVCVLLITTVLGSSKIGAAKSRTSRPAPEYVRLKTFVHMLLEEMEVITPDTSEDGAIRKAIKIGILKDGEYKDYKKNTLQIDCALLLDRADQYLYQGKVDQKQMDTIIKERISNIYSIDYDKRASVASVYAKGIMVGESDGDYKFTRHFMAGEKLTKETANGFIHALLDKTKRASVDNEGKLLKFNNLPKNADKFAYVYECIPNEFYEKPFRFEQHSLWNTKQWNFVNLKNYAYPVDIDKTEYDSNSFTVPFKNQREACINDWTKKVHTYLENAFTINYLYTSTNWMEKIKPSFANTEEEEIERYLSDYAAFLWQYKVNIQYDRIYVDPTTLHKSFDGYYMRVAIRYCVNVEVIPEKLNRLIYSSNVQIKDFKSGEWREDYFDIQLIPANPYDTFILNYGVNPELSLIN